MAYQFDNMGKLRQLTAQELAEADKDSSVIVEDKGTMANGEPYWVYIAVKPSKYAEFMQLTSQRKPLNMYEYGKLLAYGFESEVPAAVKAEMKVRYGCDDNFMTTLAKEVREAQTEFIKQQETQRISDIVAMLKKKAP